MRNIVIGIVAILIVLAAIAVVTGAGLNYGQQQTQSNSSSSQSSLQSSSNSSSSETAGTEFDITLKSYSITPKQITVDAGKTITLNVSSDSGTHNFVIDGLNVATDLLATGETQTITVTIPRDAAGKTYTYYCSVSGHKELGMVGTIQVRS